MSLNQLPAEIVAHLGSFCEDHALRSLCTTCKRLMEILERLSYRNLYLTETSKSGNAAFALAGGPRRKMINQINYVPGDPRPIKDDAHDASIKLSGSTSLVLKSLHIFFPSLETFRLDLRHWDLASYPGSTLHFADPPKIEEWEEPSWEAEPWANLLIHSFEALIKYPDVTTFSALEIFHLPPAYDTYACLFWSKRWGDLMSKLRTVNFQLAGFEGNGGINMTYAHQEFLCELAHGWFNGVPNLERVRVAGRADACIGGCPRPQAQHQYPEPIKWGSIEIPKLKAFELEWSRIDKGVPVFIERHLKSLEKIVLKHCFAGSKKYWWRLLDVVLRANPSELVELDVRPAMPQKDALDGADEHLGNITELEARSEKDNMPGVNQGPIRFVPIAVEGGHGWLEGIKEDEQDKDAWVSEREVVEKYAKVMALVERNRENVGLSLSSR